MGKKKINVPKIVTNHQADKPVSLTGDKFCDGSGFQGDVRFKEYADAMKAGDLATCDSLRRLHNEDDEFISKCNTLERKWLIQMGTYIREIQIARREAMGWRYVATGLAKYPLSATDHKKIRTGHAMIQQASNAKEEQPELNILSGFPKADVD